jgi:allantoinase
VDMVIVGGTLVQEHAQMRANLGIQSGRIAGVWAPDVVPTADAVIDATDLVVVPGAIDAHTHFTGLHDRPAESLGVGTQGAAAGGVTTILEHPQSDPPATTLERFLRKRALMAEHAVVDFGLWGGIDPASLDQLAPMHEAGAVAFKGFMCSTRAAGEAPDRFGLPRLEDEPLLRAMETVAAFGGVVGLHAENHSMLTVRTAELKARGRHDPLAHAEASPPLGEVEAVSRALLLAAASGVRCHIVHLSVAEAAARVREAKKQAAVSMETCPHYLVLDQDDLVRSGAYARCAPPLRQRANVEALWDFVFDGSIDLVASDHCPYLLEQKTGSSIWDAALGLNGIQVMGPLLFSEGVNARKLPVSDFVRLTSTGPARRFGLYPQKGTLQPGSDADVVLYDAAASWTIHSKDLHALAHWSPYEGRPVRGQVVQTLVRGRTVFKNGKILDPDTRGQFVRPINRTPASAISHDQARAADAR